MHCRVANLQALSALPAAFPTLAHTGTGGGTGAAAPLPGRFSSLAAFEAEDDFWRDVAVVHDLDSMMHSVDSRPQQPARRSRGPGMPWFQGIVSLIWPDHFCMVLQISRDARACQL